MMQVSTAPAAPGGEAFRKHAHHRVESFAREVTERIRTADHFKQRIFSPFFGCNCRDQLLRQDVQRLFRNRQLIEFATPDRIQ